MGGAKPAPELMLGRSAHDSAHFRPVLLQKRLYNLIVFFLLQPAKIIAQLDQKKGGVNTVVMTK